MGRRVAERGRERPGYHTVATIVSFLMKLTGILRKLEGGDRRSIGRSNEVVAEVLADRMLFSGLYAGLFVDDPVVRARAADAVEKISAVHPEYLRP